MNRAAKQRLLAAARLTRALPLLDRVRFMQSKRQSALGNKKFLEEHKHFSPPPLWWMHDMYRHTSYDLYWRTGQAAAQTIASKIDAYCGKPMPRVADWGCGLARVIRHLPRNYVRSGFDYNPEAIRWCAEHIDGVAFHANGLSPPLPAPENSFDAIYALSVFTHLSEKGHEAWIGEIRRVLAPSGIFLAAFHMRPAPGQLLKREQERFNNGLLVVRGKTKEGSRTFTAYHPEKYLRETLFRDFEILEEPMDFFGQTLFVVRRLP